jgi:hypothetical protein
MEGLNDSFVNRVDCPLILAVTVSKQVDFLLRT